MRGSLRKGGSRIRWPRAAAAAAFLLLWAAPAGADGGEAGIWLAKVSRKYGAVRALSARFRQEVPLARVGIVRKAQGRVWFERPLRMRWEYERPPDQLFLADGRHFWFRPSGSDRVFKSPIDERAAGGRVPLLLLFGKGELGEFFRAEEAIPRKEGAEVALRLVPRDGGAGEVRRVDLVVDAKTLAVREIHLYDRLGGSNHLFLRDLAIDPPIGEGFFRFLPIPGTEVVEG